MNSQFFLDLPQRIGWTLLHSVWQFFAIGIVLLIVIWLTRRTASTVRYAIESTGLLAMVLCAAITFCCVTVDDQFDVAVATEPLRLNTDQVAETDGVEPAFVSIPLDKQPGAPEPPSVEALPPAEATPDQATGLILADVFELWGSTVEMVKPWMPQICLTWLTGIVLLSLRPLLGLRATHRLRHRGTIPVESEIAELCGKVVNTLGIRRSVSIVQSSCVDVPTLIGWMRPLILLPASALSGLSTDQLRAIIAHELAHVRRHDYLVNVCQVLIETVFFYHPAVWWVSRRMRITREECCDDIAVRTTSDRSGYARALLWLDEHRGATSPVAFGLAASDGSLLARVRRIVRPQSSQNSDTGVLFACLLIAALTACGGFWVNAMADEGQDPSKPAEMRSDETTVSTEGQEETSQDARDTPQRTALTHWVREIGNVHSVRFAHYGLHVHSVAYGPGEAQDGRYPRVRTWDFEADRMVKDVPLEWKKEWTRYSSSFTLSDDSRFVFCSLGEKLGVWDAASGKLLRQLESNWEGFGDLTLDRIVVDRSGNTVSCRGITNRLGQLHDGYLFAWNMNSGELTRAITSQYTGDIQSIAISSDGKQLAAWPAKGGVGIWNLADGKQSFAFKNDNPKSAAPFEEKIPGALKQVLGVQFSHDGKTLAIADLVGIKLIDIESGKVTRKIRAPFRYNRPTLVFSPDDRHLLRHGVRWQGRDDAELWDVATGESVAAFPIDGNAAAFSSDGGWLAIGRNDKQQAIGVWKLTNETVSIGRPGSAPIVVDRSAIQRRIAEQSTTVVDRHLQNPADTKRATPQAAPTTETPNAAAPWRAFGRVVDGDGKPLEGVTIRAATGWGTLRGGGQTTTDADGRYDFRFGPGMLYADRADGTPHPQTQVAQVTATLDGHYEQNFSRHGDGMGSLQPIPDVQLKKCNKTSDQVVLPDRPREINFVMLPAATVRGTLVDEDGKPLPGYSVSLDADELPPGHSVLTSMTTNDTGRFELSNIPTSQPYQFVVRKPKEQLKSPWDDSWASGPIEFRESGDDDFVCAKPSLGLDVKADLLAVRKLRLQICGPGVHGKTARAQATEKHIDLGDVNVRVSGDSISLERFTMLLEN